MKISELLENELPRKPRTHSALPTAASLDDAPEELEYDSDVENSDDVEQGLSDGARDFISKAGDLGNDLYALTIYNYSDDWANVNPGTPVRSVIERAAEGDSDNEHVANAYLNQEDSFIANERMISQMILNGRNGAMFAFSAGINAKPQFNPSAKNLVDSDQLSVLKSIMSAGNAYYKAATAFDNESGFRAGYEADKATYHAGQSLLDELKNQGFVKNKSISGKQANQNMADYKQKWLDIINDPNASEFRKENAKDKLSRMGA